jgi:hypothetical protein
MATPGKIVVTANGKRGVLTIGKVAVFNADGDCPECCGVEPCPSCKVDTTPEIITFTFTGVQPASGCSLAQYIGYDGGQYFTKWVEAPAGLSEAVAEQEKGAPCQYSVVVPATAGQIALYDSDTDCASDINRVATATLQSFVVTTQFNPWVQVIVTLVFDLFIRHIYWGDSPLYWIATAPHDLPSDEGYTLCLTEWDEDSVSLIDNWLYSCAYGGSVKAVPSR